MAVVKLSIEGAGIREGTYYAEYPVNDEEDVVRVAENLAAYVIRSFAELGVINTFALLSAGTLLDAARLIDRASR